MRDGHDHVEEGEIREMGGDKIDKEAEIRESKERQEVSWVTWQQPGNLGVGKAWLLPGDCRDGVQPEH